MFQLVLPFPPYWEALTQQLAMALFSESGDINTVRFPFWLTVAEIANRPTVPPPFKGFFRLTEIVNRRGRLILCFETECALPQQHQNGTITFGNRQIQSVELDGGLIGQTLSPAANSLLNRLSRRKIKTAPCYLETKMLNSDKQSYIRLFR